MDINKPIANPALVSTIGALQENDTPETVKCFVQELKNAHFLTPVIISPVPVADETGKAVLKTDTTISPLSLENANGDIFLIVFTDWESLRKWRNIEDEQTLVTSYEDICQMTNASEKYRGFAINPMSENIVITKELIEQYNNPTVQPYTVEKDTKVSIGVPANYPEEMVGAVSAYMKKQKHIKSAYLVLMMKDNEQSFLMIVDFQGDRQTTFGEIASVAVPLLRQGELLDMVPLESEIGADVANEYKPFYQKKRFGLF